MHDKWIIIEHEEFKKTIKLVRQPIRDRVEKELKPMMEQDPFSNKAIKLIGKLKGYWEQKYGLEEYRLVFKILNYNSKKVEFSWIRKKPLVTAKRWVP